MVNMQVGIGSICVKGKCVMDNKLEIQKIKVKTLSAVEKAFDRAITEDNFNFTQNLKMTLELSSGYISVSTSTVQNSFTNFEVKNGK